MLAKWMANDSNNILFNNSREDSYVNAYAFTTGAGEIAGYVFVMVLSLVGNILVLLIIYRDRRLRTNVNFFIANMAASDLLFPTFAVPFRISSLLTGAKWIVHGVIGEALCKLVAFAADISSMVSVLCLVAIAVDRFDAIVFPMTSQLITKKVRTVILISTWLLSAVFLSPYFYAMQLRVGGHNATECLFTWGDNQKSTFSAQKAYIFVNFACFITLPFLLLTVMYSIIIFSLVRQKTFQTSPVFSTQERKKRTKENLRVIIMLVVVLFIFVSAFVPLNIIFFLFFLKKQTFNLSSPLLRASHFLAVTYPAANPFVYYFFNEKYRKGFHKLLFKRK